MHTLKSRKTTVSNLWLHLQEKGKREQAKPEISRRKEIIKNRTGKKMNETKC
jgi:uncharacterized protein YjbJ (UPF0337 family)